MSLSRQQGSGHRSPAPYQLLPPLTDAEYTALRDDIAEYGYDPAHPVVVDEAGQILDGHHRARACTELGVAYPVVVATGLDDDGKRAYALRANTSRRQLTLAQRRDLIRAELAYDPHRSNRAIARLLGVDHKTVAAVRHGEFPPTRSIQTWPRSRR